MRRGFVAAVILGLVGTGVLIGLGVWQLQRLERKEGLIGRLEARLAAEPVALPAEPDPERDNFLRVVVAGEVGEQAAWLLTTERPWGPGFRVIAPLVLDEGRRVLVDLGYVPEAMKGEALPAGARVEATGTLYWPEGYDPFTPEPDPAENIWFARDPEAMARAFGTAPVLVVADTHSLGEWPRPLRLGVNLRNDHLGYAITWFSLAVIWAVMSALLARRERRRPSE